MEFNIDTYYNYGDKNYIVPHHIDMISKHIIPNTNNIPNLSDPDWHLRADNNNGNNGTSSIKNPYLASNEDKCLLKQLESYYSNNIPNVLKPYLLNKRYYAPTRYNSSGSTLLTDDNGAQWVSLGMLWIPFEAEVFGNTIWATKGYSSQGARQYPCFKDGDSIVKNETNSSSSRARWWLADAASGKSGYFCGVEERGCCGNWFYPAICDMGCVLCFRFV
jgi:hypothetical protein